MNTCSLPGFCPPHLLSNMPPKTPILLALSGGPDSVVLLHLLAGYAKENGTPLHVAHVDHCLRGEDSERDHVFCRALTQQYGLPFHSLTADVAALSATHKCGIEEEARRVRYAFFADLMKQHAIPLLATAHHADDNAETVLFHVARGTGLTGLCGIAPVRPFGEGLLIRPLLAVTKADVLSFCQTQGLATVTDATNSDIIYARNRLRHKVLPQLAEINTGALANITRLCRTLRADEDYLMGAAREFRKTHEKNGAVETQALSRAHPAVASRVVALMAAPHTLSAAHISAVLSLAEKAEPHSTLDLGNGLRAVVEPGGLSLTTEEPAAPAPQFSYPLSLGLTYIPEAEAAFFVQKDGQPEITDKNFKNIYKKATTMRISSDTIGNEFYTRNRREGDVICQNEMHKKLKKLMSDKKLPLPLRSRLPLLCNAQGILWVPGLAVGDGAAGEGLTVTLYYNDESVFWKGW